jgi:hypothetical protein
MESPPPLKSIEIPVRTKYYFDNYEIEIDHRTHQTRELHYLASSTGLFAIIEKNDDALTPYYIHTDYQGSFNVITNDEVEKVETLSFDPWGRRRNATDWSFNDVPSTFLFDRGYTSAKQVCE